MLNDKSKVLQDALQKIQDKDNSFVKLSLKNLKLTDEDIRSLCDALTTHNNTTLKTLDLSYNTLSLNSIHALKILSISELNLDCTGITTDAVDLLLTNSKLSILYLRHNNLNALNEAAFLQNQTLHTLDASSNQLSGVGTMAITKSSSIKVLDLSANQLRQNDINQIVMAQFTHVALRNNYLTDDSVQPIVTHKPQWQTLGLEHNNITTKKGQELKNVLPACKINFGSTDVLSAPDIDVDNSGFDSPVTYSLP